MTTSQETGKRLVVLHFNKLSADESSVLHQMAHAHNGQLLQAQHIKESGFMVEGCDISSKANMLVGVRDQVRVFLFPNDGESRWRFGVDMAKAGLNRNVTYCSNTDLKRPQPHFTQA